MYVITMTVRKDSRWLFPSLTGRRKYYLQNTTGNETRYIIVNADGRHLQFGSIYQRVLGTDKTLDYSKCGSISQAFMQTSVDGPSQPPRASIVTATRNAIPPASPYSMHIAVFTQAAYSTVEDTATDRLSIKTTVACLAIVYGFGIGINDVFPL
ncbi:uncharacterized protein BT62DRAFT_1004685 [Guyanagaster necrorhizus]|uniref:Uncharacterized protein n=1 Tax=Guyanagaster necrorhizus TaxID=856835 RepID=A0A9P8AT72_9AGAR|nr:uncharacterized protein BT62DRAFT_1004685 [Guyanagaster necrorhizus MCA 3950]KAG7447109.1 hypothetical protein BT62DRAFT_1004685 [Guyanagaster necrorhizus MCA 3950]